MLIISLSNSIIKEKREHREWEYRGKMPVPEERAVKLGEIGGKLGNMH